VTHRQRWSWSLVLENQSDLLVLPKQLTEVSARGAHGNRAFKKTKTKTKTKNKKRHPASTLKQSCL
jgi:hypothetical protein